MRAYKQFNHFICALLSSKTTLDVLVTKENSSCDQAEQDSNALELKLIAWKTSPSYLVKISVDSPEVVIRWILQTWTWETIQCKELHRTGFNVHSFVNRKFNVHSFHNHLY